MRRVSRNPFETAMKEYPDVTPRMRRVSRNDCDGGKFKVYKVTPRMRRVSRNSGTEKQVKWANKSRLA